MLKKPREERKLQVLYPRLFNNHILFIFNCGYVYHILYSSKFPIIANYLKQSFVALSRNAGRTGRCRNLNMVWKKKSSGINKKASVSIYKQTCHNSGLTGIYPGDGKKIPVSGQLSQNSGELPFTRNFLAARFFFFTILSNIFFS